MSGNLSVVLLDGDDHGEPDVRVALFSEANDILLNNDFSSKFILNDKHTSDLELEYKGKIYFVHSLKLRTSSPYFEEKIAELEKSNSIEPSMALPVKKENLKTVRMKLVLDLNIDENIIKSILIYIYKGKIRVPQRGKELAYFRAAKLFKLDKLCSVLRGYMGSYFTALDASTIVEIAKNNNFGMLYEMCIRIIGSHASEIFSKQAHMIWSKDHMLSMAQSPTLNVEEYEIYKAIDQYINRHVSNMELKNEKKVNRMALKDKLWKEFEPHIRWGQIPPDTIFTHIEGKNKHISKELLNEAYKWSVLGGDDMEQAYLSTFKYAKNLRAREQGSGGWIFDKKRCNSNILISHKGYRIKHNTGSGHSSVLGTRGFKTGNHKIKIKILGPSHWVGIGMIFPSKATSTLTNDYSYFYGASSANQRYQSQGQLVQWQTGDVVQMSLKFRNKACHFEMTVIGKTTTLLTANIPMGKEALHPIVNLYTSGNEVEIVK
mmetsp:Transcript_8739/g.12929  ORF Transcript_8739/g.12929 Transcript_8739/m.12929 type:complete len:489 (-) Transcript_8739:32-1498(-)